MSPREEPKWSGPETALTKDEAALIVRLTQLVKRFPSDQEPDDTPVDGYLTVKQACDAREALRNLSRERYWRQWEKGVETLSRPPVKAASPEGADAIQWISAQLEVGVTIISLTERQARTLLPTSERAEVVAWRTIDSAPHACHVLAARFDDCEWVCAVVLSPPSYPFTHWAELPPMPGCAPAPAQQVEPSLPQDVIDLVIAAREVAYDGPREREFEDLDRALEAFASRVPWDDEPAPDSQGGAS